MRDSAGISPDFARYRHPDAAGASSTILVARNQRHRRYLCPMKTVIALVVSIAIALVVAVRINQTPAPPTRAAGSWEPAETAVQ